MILRKYRKNKDANLHVISRADAASIMNVSERSVATFRISAEGCASGRNPNNCLWRIAIAYTLAVVDCRGKINAMGGE